MSLASSHLHIFQLYILWQNEKKKLKDFREEVVRIQWILEVWDSTVGKKKLLIKTEAVIGTKQNFLQYLLISHPIVHRHKKRLELGYS